MIKLLLLGVMLLMLAACGGAPSGPTAASTVPTMLTTTMTSPMASMSTASVSEAVIAPSATNDLPPAALSDDTILCRLTQSGGLAGSTETTTVRVNGEVTAQRDRPTPRSGTTQATPEQLAALRAALESEAWQQLQPRYGRAIPDGFTYEVQCGGTTITSYDGAKRPDVLSQVIQQLGALRRQALQQ